MEEMRQKFSSVWNLRTRPGSKGILEVVKLRAVPSSLTAPGAPVPPESGKEAGLNGDVLEGKTHTRLPASAPMKRNGEKNQFVLI